MKHTFRVISTSGIDISKLAGASHQSTGKRISDFADQHALKGDRRLATCLLNLLDQAPELVQPIIHYHLSVTGFLICSTHLVPTVMQACALAVLSTPCQYPDLSAMLMTGNLAEWKSSIEAGLAFKADVEFKSIWTEIQNGIATVLS